MHWQEAKAARERCTKFATWLAALRADQPDILIGANLKWGGVRNHIHAIKRYSSLHVELVPGDDLMDDFSIEMRESFLNFKPSAVRAVHSHVFPWFIAWCRKQQQAGIRWIHTYHLNYFAEHGKGDLLPWQKEVNAALLHDAPRADVRISVARWQQDYLAKNHQIETVYLPNGVDVALCDRADAHRFQKKVGGDPFVLYVGRNDPVKNPADFVRLAQRLPGQKFVMLGHGLSPAVLHEEWGVEVPTNLRVLGSASHLEVQDALAACSALVVTSKREGLPTLVMEAMAQCKPVVVPNEAGCREAVGEGDFGLIYRQNDLDDLAEKTLKALADTERSQRARQRVLSEYDWRVIAPKLDAIYCG
jgi:glycosyltransferase involved in cell wall biosynthesis